jgi:hypothetical protein
LGRLDVGYLLAMQAVWTAQIAGFEELYSHHGDDGTDFDSFENQNLVAGNANQAAVMFAQLRAMYDVPPV